MKQPVLRGINIFSSSILGLCFLYGCFFSSTSFAVAHKVEVRGCDGLQEDVKIFLDTNENFEVVLISNSDNQVSKKNLTDSKANSQSDTSNSSNLGEIHSVLILSCKKSRTRATWYLKFNNRRYKIAQDQLRHSANKSVIRRYELIGILRRLMEKLPFDSQVEIDKFNEKLEVASNINVYNTKNLNVCSTVELLKFSPNSKVKERPFTFISDGVVMEVGEKKSKIFFPPIPSNKATASTLFFIKTINKRTLKPGSIATNANQCIKSGFNSHKEKFFDVSSIKQVAGIISTNFKNGDGMSASPLAAVVMNQVGFGKYLMLKAEAFLTLTKPQFTVDKENIENPNKVAASIIQGYLVPKWQILGNNFGLGIGVIRDRINDQYTNAEGEVVNRPQDTFRSSFALSYKFDYKKIWLDAFAQFSRAAGGNQSSITLRAQHKFSETWQIGVILMQHSIAKNGEKKKMDIKGQGIEIGFGL